MNQRRPVVLQRQCFSPEKNCQHYNRQEGSTASENGNSTYLGLPILALPNTHVVLQGSKKLTVG
jgi:hypothetical protein